MFDIGEEFDILSGPYTNRVKAMTAARKTRVRRVASTSGAKRSLNDKLKKAAEALRQIEEGNEALDKLKPWIEDLLKEAGLVTYQAHGAVASMVASPGRASTEIDVVAFRAAVSDADFMSSISVGVTKAKKVMTDKELGKVSTKIPGKPGEPTLKVVLQK
jgi:hypothetical protein